MNNEEFRKDQLRGWDFRNENNELSHYFATSEVISNEVSGKMGGKNKTGNRIYALNRGCKYEDEKDPLCSKYNANNLTGCCIYHRYKYNELLAGEKISDFVIENLNKKGAQIDKIKLTEWENFSE